MIDQLRSSSCSNRETKPPIHTTWENTVRHHGAFDGADIIFV